MELFPEYLPRVVYCDSPYQAASGTNALLIITEWKEFLDLDLKKLKDVMANPIIIDGRNIFDSASVKKLGFEYYSVGRE
jgi:UDPglucose 6-dehydrogenase